MDRKRGGFRTRDKNEEQDCVGTNFLKTLHKTLRHTESTLGLKVQCDSIVDVIVRVRVSVLTKVRRVGSVVRKFN